MNKIEHLGIAVRDMEQSRALFENLLGTACYKEERVDTEGVVTAFFRVGESKVELLQATNPDSPVARFIEKRGEGIHHVAFDVSDIDEKVAELRNSGFEIIGNVHDGADNKRVIFVHPKSANGVLVELCEEKNPSH